MKAAIGNKIMAGFLLVMLAMGGLAYYLVLAGEHHLHEAIGRESADLAAFLLKRIDRRILALTRELQIHTSHNPQLFEHLAAAKARFASLPDRERVIAARDREWSAMDNRSPLIQAVTDSPLSARMRREFLEVALLQYGYPIFAEVFFTDAYGTVTAATGRTDDYRQDDEQWWRIAREEGLAIGDVEYDESSATMGIGIALRVSDDQGEFLGVMKAVIAVSGLIRQVELSEKRFETTRISLLTHDGRLLYRSTAHRVQEDLSTAPFWARIQSRQGYFTAGEGGRQRLYAFSRPGDSSPTRGLRWLMVIDHDLDEIMAPASALVRRLLGAVGLFILLGIGVALCTTRSITRPLRALVGDTEIIGRGDLGHTVAVTTRDEIGELAAAFNRMTGNLRKTTASRNELEREIAERIKTEKCLRDSEERFRATFEQAAVGMALVTPDGGWLRVNDRLCAMLDYSREELLSKTFQDITDPDDLAADLDNVARMLGGEISSYSMEKRYFRKDGSLLWTNLTVALVHKEDGAPDYFISVIEDISGRKAEEERRRRAETVLAEKNREMEQLIYITSHDLRSPLVNVQGFSRELEHSLAELGAALKQSDAGPELPPVLARCLDEDIPGALRYIKTGIDKMDALLAGLLQFSRLGRTVLDMREIDMNRLLREVASTFDFRLREAGARLELTDLPGCRGDASRLGQVFANLIDNSLKYHDPARSGLIRISGRREKGWLVYLVEDNGMGVAAEHQAKVFELFHRLEPGRTKGEGLGLSIVRKIVEMHGGTVAMESEPGQGTRMILRLPG
ncbi:MAG: PAS domain S-box protein [Thermodesulfobacteriota bacterium]